MPKRGLMPNETACESSQMPAVAPPGDSWRGLFFVSRATRGILTPFGVPLMYSALQSGVESGVESGVGSGVGLGSGVGSGVALG